jgi:hypothetical protein
MTTGKYNSKKGWYWSVGDRYWGGQGYDRIGLGIEASLIKGHDMLEVKLGGNQYLLNCKEAVEFIKRFHSFEVLKGKKIGYVSKSLFKLEESEQQKLI